MTPYRTPAPNILEQPTVIGNVGLSMKTCLCEYENEIKRLTEENKRLKLALSEKLHALLSTNY